jgi:hypothetical protein
MHEQGDHHAVAAPREKENTIVILPMVLQIHKTMVLQRVELDGKARSSPFEVFGLVEALMGKHGFAEKIQK